MAVTKVVHQPKRVVYLCCVFLYLCLEREEGGVLECPNPQMNIVTDFFLQPHLFEDGD